MAPAFRARLSKSTWCLSQVRQPWVYWDLVEENVLGALGAGLDLSPAAEDSLQPDQLEQGMVEGGGSRATPAGVPPTRSRNVPRPASTFSY